MHKYKHSPVIMLAFVYDIYLPEGQPDLPENPANSESNFCRSIIIKFSIKSKSLFLQQFKEIKKKKINH